MENRDARFISDCGHGTSVSAEKVEGHLEIGCTSCCSVSIRFVVFLLLWENLVCRENVNNIILKGNRHNNTWRLCYEIIKSFIF